MTLDKTVYEGLYLVVSVRARCEKGSWVRIWGSGGFWTVFVLDTEDQNGIWLPVRQNDLLVKRKAKNKPPYGRSDFRHRTTLSVRCDGRPLCTVEISLFLLVAECRLL